MKARSKTSKMRSEMSGDRSETLVVLTPAFPAHEAETNWVPTQQLFVKALKDQFPQLHITVLSFYYPYQATRYEWKGIGIRSFSGMRQRKWKRPFFWYTIWKELKALRREKNIIGLLSFWCGECALMGHYFGRRYGIPHYCWLCGQDARAGNRLVKFIRPAADELIAMSDFLAEEFYRNHGIRPQHIIPNGIDPELFGPGHGQSPSDAPVERDIDLLGAGSLSPLKRYELFVEIVRSLTTIYPDIRARICGDGAEKEHLQSLIKAYGLENNLLLAGEKPQQEVIRLMQRTKLFLHTSDYEGFGVACLEALYAGAYVISFCWPMRQDIPHWYIVANAGEMLKKATAILQSPDRDHRPVLQYTMSDSVRAVMVLFRERRGKDAPLYGSDIPQQGNDPQ